MYTIPDDCINIKIFNEQSRIRSGIGISSYTFNKTSDVFETFASGKFNGTLS